jgi:hypothetical protein
MERHDLKMCRGFLRKMLATVEKSKPYYKDLQFFNNRKEWPVE